MNTYLVSWENTVTGTKLSECPRGMKINLCQQFLFHFYSKTYTAEEIV